jgi:hypothetical protein
MGAEISPFGPRPFRRPFRSRAGKWEDPPTIGLPSAFCARRVSCREVELHVNLALRALRKLQQGEPVAAGCLPLTLADYL